MSHSRIATGKKGEEMAAAFLTGAGYRVIERNYRCCFGEIDIVAQEGETLVFVEVKSRRSEAFGEPQLAVGRQKQEKLSRTAMHYLAQRGQGRRLARFDVVSVKWLPEGRTIDLIRNAFEVVCG